MRKSFLTGTLLLAAFVLVPSCVEVSDEPTTDEQSVVSTEEDLIAGEILMLDEDLMVDEEATVSDLPDATDVTATGPDTMKLADCQNGKFCVWRSKNFTGGRANYKPTVSGCRNFSILGYNNAVSSWFNKTSKTWTLYRDNGCTGLRFTVSSGGKASSTGPEWDNKLSSICSGDCP